MERPYFCDINERNYRVKNCANYWHHVLYVSEGSNHVTATWKKDFFPLLVCLFLFFFLLSAFLVFFSSYFFCYPHFFFPSAFFYPHFPIRIRHPQVSGPRFTDTRLIKLVDFVLCRKQWKRKLPWSTIFHELKGVVKAKIAQDNSQISEGGITVKPGQDSIHELNIWKAEPVCRFCNL